MWWCRSLSRSAMWATPNLDFKVTVFFNITYLENGTRYRRQLNIKWRIELCHQQLPWSTFRSFQLFCLKINVGYFSVSDRKAGQSNDGLYYQGPWVSFGNYIGQMSYASKDFYCRNQLEWLLCNPECNLLVIACVFCLFLCSGIILALQICVCALLHFMAKLQHQALFIQRM